MTRASSPDCWNIRSIRVRVFEGLAVPEVLLGGDHEEIRKWRLARAFERTLEKRPELLELLKGEEPLDRRDETQA